MNRIKLSGCTPNPLMSYLKALGIFRLIAEQRDERATISWLAEQMHLETELNQEEVIEFFLHDYQPSPIMAPWNGGSGFFAGDNQMSLKGLLASEADRFQLIRTSLHKANDVLSAIKLSAKPEKEEKSALLERLRNELPDASLDWLDAVAVVAGGTPKFPPLLGTGGNDGRLEFTNNFHQRLLELFDLESGEPLPTTNDALEQALFSTPAPVNISAPSGFFSPGTAGGANAASGFDGKAMVNPWDFVFMLEGALLFAASCNRRFDRQMQYAQALSYPFAVRATGGGYTSDSLDEAKDARAEMWLPTWASPMDLPQLKFLFSEGRAQVSGRPARSGLDFALALGSYGVDAGLDYFYRYSFVVRNGLAYFAVAMDRFKVRRNPDTPLIMELRPWLNRLEQAANSTKPHPPASVPPVVQGLQRAIFRQAHQPGDPKRLEDLLLAAGDAERRLNRTLRWTRDTAKGLRPCFRLSREWFRSSSRDKNRQTPEFRLAASLASSYLCQHEPYTASDGKKYDKPVFPFRLLMENVAPTRVNDVFGQVDWLAQPSNDVVWTEGDVIDSMVKALLRLIVIHPRKALSKWSLKSAHPARLSDIKLFLSDSIDLSYFERCLWGLILLRWRASRSQEETPPMAKIPLPAMPSLYTLLKLCFAGHPVRGETVPLRGDIAHLAGAASSKGASEAAIIRLRGSSLSPLLPALWLDDGGTRRTAAALLFPLSHYSTQHLAKNILPEPESGSKSSQQQQPENQQA